MKKIFYAFPLLALISCGGNDSESDKQITTSDTVYTTDDQLAVNAKELKEKLGVIQQSFVDIGNKEVEETICTESSTISYNGNQDEMNIWLLSTYMLDNFSNETFGKNNFGMPDAMIKEVTPLSELSWINFNNSDSTIFDIYKQYPDLESIPKEDMQKEMLQKSDMALNAIKDGLLGVIAITDYLPPSYSEDAGLETGYLMGYIMFANWNTGELSCISPILGVNSNDENFLFVKGKEQNTVDVMQENLIEQTYSVIDSIARLRTGFEGAVFVNDKKKLKEYRK